MRERERRRLKRWEERWTRTGKGASIALCLEKLLHMGSDCRCQQDVGVEVGCIGQEQKEFERIFFFFLFVQESSIQQAHGYLCSS